MAAKNALTTTPPFMVEQTLTRLGAALRLARLRRRLTIAEVAEKIGTGYRAVADAEKGKPSTGIVVYAALLWVYRLLPELDAITEPERDIEGQALARAREPKRARPAPMMDNDF